MPEALVVIDMQCDYFADGELARCRQDLVATINRVAGTAVDAFAHDFFVTVVSDATASIDPTLHDDALRRVQSQYRQQVATADEVAAAWAAA